MLCLWFSMRCVPLSISIYTLRMQCNLSNDMQSTVSKMEMEHLLFQRIYRRSGNCIELIDHHNTVHMLERNLSILSYPILSYPFLSFLILSYHILSYPILSYPMHHRNPSRDTAVLLSLLISICAFTARLFVLTLQAFLVLNFCLL